MNARELLLNFFDEIIHQIEELKDVDIKKLETGEFSLSLRVVKRKSTQNTPAELSKEYIEDIKQELMEANTRDAGYKIIQNHLKNKKQLESFAKSVDVFVMKQDKVEKIREKIIEGIVGARLRSDAIQDNKT